MKTLNDFIQGLQQNQFNLSREEQQELIRLLEELQVLRKRCPVQDDNLKTEYSFEFDNIRQRMMLMGYYQYGPAAKNYPSRIKALDSLEKRLKQYDATGNKEMLADAANFLMLEFMHPAHPKAHYKATDSEESPGVVGLGIAEYKSKSLS